MLDGERGNECRSWRPYSQALEFAAAFSFHRSAQKLYLPI